MRRRVRRSKRSVELMWVAALETDRIFCPPGESAEPSGPWKPWVVRAIEISAPAGRTDQPAGVTRPLRAGLGGRGQPGEREQEEGGDASDHHIRRGRADGSHAAAIVAADGHPAPAPSSPPWGRRGRRRPAAARLRAVVPQLRRALRAGVGARPRHGLTPDYTAATRRRRTRWRLPCRLARRCRSATAATRSWSWAVLLVLRRCSCGSPTGSAPSCSRRAVGVVTAVVVLTRPGARARRAARPTRTRRSRRWSWGRCCSRRGGRGAA